MRINKQYRAQIIPMLHAGIPVPQIYKQLKCNHHLVLKCARELGLVQKESLVPRYNWKEVQAYYDEGHNIQECLKHFGFTMSAWSHANERGKIKQDPSRQRNHPCRDDLRGRRFGKLQVIELDNSKLDKQRHWKCVCDCGESKIIRTSELIRGSHMSCGCYRSPKGEDSAVWTGHGEISGSLWSSIVHGSKVRNKKISFNITMEQAWDLFLKQDRKCAISGITLIMKGEKKKRNGTASLDRIDSSKGYEIDNIQWVHKDINVMKLDHTMDYFLSLVKIIYQYQSKTK